MVTSTVAVPTRSRQRLALRIVAWALPALLVIGIGAVTWFYAAAHAALPQTDGRIAVSGLNSPVMVARDAQGVPHISAATLDDLFFAQGYVTAQDRLWQMDMLRRYAAGEIAEVLGSGYLKHDQQQRTLQIRAASENAAARLVPEERSRFEAYARGVNAYIATQRHLPIEFQVLGYRPRPWTVTDSILVAANMIQMLNLETLGHVMAREKLTAKLSPELATDLYPNASWRDHPPVSAPGEDEFTPADGEAQPEEQQPEPPPARRSRRHGRRRVAQDMLFDGQALAPGSNNWVVSGAHTVSGKPLLANDMHLGHQVPNVWYEAHLTLASSADPAYDVAGVTLPGLPYVISGHNQRIAWGFTNIGPAVSDVYVENFNATGEYQTPDGWQQPEHRREVIRVKHQRDQVLDVMVTRHGPIVSGIEFPSRIFGGSTAPLDPTRKLALKWTLYDPATVQVPFFAMNTARNWDEFRRALSQFGSPAQNVVYADVDGHIGYQATGMVPVRASGDGSVPVSGADSAHEWTGYVPFEQLPSVLDPPSGILATANGRITPTGYAQLLSNEWGPPYRTERIYHVLSSGKKLSASDMLALQTDIYSDFDRFCAQRFVYAIDHAGNASARAHQAAEVMRAWDGTEGADSGAATVVARSRQELARLLLQPKLGDEWRDYRWFMSSVWLEGLLLRKPARWLPANYASWDDLLTAAVQGAVQQGPSEPRDWRWGNEQPLDLRHPIFGSVPGLRHWAGTGTRPQSGNGYTVKQVGSWFGPSERLTVDFGDLDGSTLNIVNGQSGQIFSPHFNDQWQAWYEGRTFPMPFTAAAVQKAKKRELLLEPAK